MKYSQTKLAFVLALPFLLATTGSQAASKSEEAAKKQSADTAIYKAREKCITEAIAAVPGNPTDESGVMTLRTGKYRDCAKRNGFRP